ncbi:shikimate kinase [Muriicola sp. SD30]|uniref:shikimate kinase n=1 Tax=Muriicola sp. SD30 TaxID=3240936 RepID=UPI00350F7349
MSTSKIILIGYMGSGKTVVGKELARQRNLRFVDLDDYLEDQTGNSIPEIFQNKGEIFFRKEEHKYLKEVLNSNENLVLSTGGGTPCYSGNMELLLQATPNVFYLQMSVGGLVQRLSLEKDNRPVISHLEKEELPDYIGKHIFERQAFYTRATHTIPCDGKSVEEIVNSISDLLV